jgi:hypothetical protein
MRITSKQVFIPPWVFRNIWSQHRARGWQRRLAGRGSSTVSTCAAWGTSYFSNFFHVSDDLRRLPCDLVEGPEKDDMGYFAGETIAFLQTFGSDQIHGSEQQPITLNGAAQQQGMGGLFGPADFSPMRIRR